MMRKILFIFALALLCGALALSYSSRNSGYVLIALGQTSIEMSLWMAILALTLTFATLFLSLRTAYRLSHFLRTRSLQKRQQKSSAGLRAFVEARWPQAQSQLSKTAVQAADPLANMLLATKAACHAQDFDQAEALLKQAEQLEPDAFASALTRAEVQIAQQQWENAIASLNQLLKLNPKNTAVIRLLQRCYEETQDWHNLGLLLADMRKAGIYHKEKLDELEAHYNRALLLNAYNRVKNQQHPVQALNDIWNNLPRAAQKSRQLIFIYNDTLRQLGEQVLAEQQVRDKLKSHWSDELITLYGLLQGEQAEKQLLAAESHLKERPNNPQLLLCLGRLAQRCHQWDKATQYYRACLQQGDNNEAGLELARLQLAMGHSAEARRLFKQHLPLPQNHLPTGM